MRAQVVALIFARKIKDIVMCYVFVLKDLFDCSSVVKNSHNVELIFNPWLNLFIIIVLLICSYIDKNQLKCIFHYEINDTKYTSIKEISAVNKEKIYPIKRLQDSLGSKNIMKTSAN